MLTGDIFDLFFWFCLDFDTQHHRHGSYCSSYDTTISVSLSQTLNSSWWFGSAWRGGRLLGSYPWRLSSSREKRMWSNRSRTRNHKDQNEVSCLPGRRSCCFKFYISIISQIRLRPPEPRRDLRCGAAGNESTTSADKHTTV